MVEVTGGSVRRSVNRSLARTWLGASAFLVTLSVAAVTSAAPPGGSNDDNLISYERPEIERRGGFAIGLTSGLSLVDFSGYPNRVSAIGDASQEEATGANLGSNFGFWVGGSPRDWITLGAGIASTATLGGDYTASNAAFVLHAEVFPLYSLGGTFRDLGLAVDGGPSFGAMYSSKDKDLENILADGGSMSFLSSTVFWEPIRFWHFSTGPAFVASHSFSQTLTVNQFALSWRIVFYGDQPKDPPAGAQPSETAGFGTVTY